MKQALLLNEQWQISGIFKYKYPTRGRLTLMLNNFSKNKIFCQNKILLIILHALTLKKYHASQVMSIFLDKTYEQFLSRVGILRLNCIKLQMRIYLLLTFGRADSVSSVNCLYQDLCLSINFCPMWLQANNFSIILPSGSCLSAFRCSLRSITKRLSYICSLEVQSSLV